MYSLKVRANLGGKERGTQPAERPQEQAEGGSKGQAGDQEGATSAPDAPASLEEEDHVSFSAGNPRVEHITGVVHLYRHIPVEEPAEESGQGASSTGGAWTRHTRPASLRRPPGDDGEITPGGGDDSPSPFAQLAFPAGRNEQLCILALPADMGFAELCTFLGGYFPQVRELRLVRREGGGSTLCSVLVRFEDQAAADDFYTHYNGKPFCLLEPEVLCRLVFVKDVEYHSGVEDSDQAFRAPAGTSELPTCPVCLERLDEHISGIVTTVCNHRFHNECLRQWGDTSCPVCRYCQHSAATTSHCTVCNTTSDLWICLICGHVGCGRYRGLHAAAHWQESGHGYALELETQRVWDYVNDSYVHRLIQSKTDGKLVEVPSPAVTGSGSAAQPPCCSRSQSRAGGGICGSEYGEDPEYDEALVISKLDALATEYNHLLVTQLESQRTFFEGQLVRQRTEMDAEVAELREAVSKAEAEAAKARAAAEDSERRRRHADSKLADANTKLQASQREAGFLKQLNDTLLANQKDYQARLAAAQAQLESATRQRDATIQDLQDQVRDLMVFIEARQTIENVNGGAAGGGGDLAGATVLPLPPAPVEQQQQQQGGKGKGSRRRR